MSQIADGRRVYILAIIILSLALVTVALSSYFAIATLGEALAKAPVEDDTLSVSGSAAVKAVPDLGSVTLGVDTLSETAGDAVVQNAEVMQDVIDALKGIGLQDREIRTSHFSLTPEYRFEKDGNPVLIGYRASNFVQITTSKTDLMGGIVDVATEAGSNRVEGISFTVSEKTQKNLRDEAIGMAVEDAAARATKALEPLKLKITGVKSVSISDATPFFGLRMIGEQAATPILPGELEVRVSVQIIYKIG